METLQTEKRKKINVFGYPVEITSRERAVNFVFDCIEHGKGIQVVTINPEMIRAADNNPELARIIRAAELVIPDSTGIMLAIRSLGIFSAEKIPGIEVSEELMKKSEEKGVKAAFLGGSKDTIQSLKIEINKKFPKLNTVFFHHGYFKNNDLNNILDKLQETGPHLLFVALGTPKQEFFIKNNRDILSKTVMIGIGGSFDVWAKKIKRAPVLFRIFGLEWFYRLITQPKRVNRMFPVLPLFFFRILFDRINLRKEF